MQHALTESVTAELATLKFVESSSKRERVKISHSAASILAVFVLTFNRYKHRIQRTPNRFKVTNYETN
jgi:hypothetical protein